MNYTFPWLYKPEVNFDRDHITALHSPTRSGKTTRLINIGTEVRNSETPMIPLLFTDNSGAGLQDARVKALSQGWKDDEIIFLNKDSRVYTFLEQIRGLNLEDKYFFMANSDHHHYKRLIAAIKKKDGSLSDGISSGCAVLQMEDEGHRGRDSTSSWTEYAARHTHLRDLHSLLHSHLLFSSATLEKDSFPDATRVNQLVTGCDYRHPTEARNIDCTMQDIRNLRDHGRLDPWIPSFIKDCELTQSLTLINGVFGTAQHERMMRQLQEMLPLRADIGILTINKSKIRLTNPMYTVDLVMDVKDTQSAIHSLYHEHGLRHIWCIGHKQAELGQTFADFLGNIWLTRQICATSINSTTNNLITKGYKPQWSSVAQWVRTGGYTVKSQQTIHMCAAQWEEYCVQTLQRDRHIREVIDGKTRLHGITANKLTVKAAANTMVVKTGNNDTKLVTEWYARYMPTKADVYALEEYSGETVFDYTQSTVMNRISLISKDHGVFQLFPKGIRKICSERTEYDLNNYKHHDWQGDIIIKGKYSIGSEIIELI